MLQWVVCSISLELEKSTISLMQVQIQIIHCLHTILARGKCQEWLVDIYLPFQKSIIIRGNFPPVSEKCCPWLVDIFLPFQKSITDDFGTFSSHFRKVKHMSWDYFLSISKICHTWLVDIFLPFSEMGDKWPLVMCYTFQKREENVH